MNRLESNTEAVLNRGLEDSTGDEGYAAWLQQREILRAKKRSGGFMEYTDSKETKPKSKLNLFLHEPSSSLVHCTVLSNIITPFTHVVLKQVYKAKLIMCIPNRLN